MNEEIHKPLKLRTKLAWISVLYLAEGFPFGMVKENLPVYFRDHGVSLTVIGLMSLIGIPWTLKFFWSPLVDRFGTRQLWITVCLITMGALMLMVPFFDPSVITLGLWIVLLCFTVASATQDIAIDAYTIGLVDRGEEGPANGVRVAAYRVAFIIGGGGMLILPGWFGWKLTFWAVAAVFALLAISAWQAPRVVIPVEKRRQWFLPMKRWLLQPGAWAVFLFILIYKLGDSAMGPMVRPFWLDRGLSVGEIGAVSNAFGVVATIAGALLGGYLISRWGIFHGLWILGLAQALSNLGYAAVAWADPAAPVITFSTFSMAGLMAALSEPARLMIYSASIMESFTAGLGTAAFLAFLMRICQKEYAATQYALLSALFALTRDLAGATSGLVTESLGYASYFGFTFLLAFPAYVFLPWVRMWIKRSGITEAEKKSE